MGKLEKETVDSEIYDHFYDPDFATIIKIGWMRDCLNGEESLHRTRNRERGWCDWIVRLNEIFSMLFI